MSNSPLRIGVSGPVASSKTALLDVLCKRVRRDFQIAVVTNDIYTEQDAQFLIGSPALDGAPIVCVEPGGCPDTSICEDASINLAAVEDLQAPFHEPGRSNRCLRSILTPLPRSLALASHRPGSPHHSIPYRPQAQQP